MLLSVYTIGYNYTQYNDTVNSPQICQYIKLVRMLNFIIQHVMTYTFAVDLT